MVKNWLTIATLRPDLTRMSPGRKFEFDLPINQFHFCLEVGAAELQTRLAAVNDGPYSTGDAIEIEIEREILKTEDRSAHLGFLRKSF
jgi:hypothetical protein